MRNQTGFSRMPIQKLSTVMCIWSSEMKLKQKVPLKQLLLSQMGLVETKVCVEYMNE